MRWPISYMTWRKAEVPILLRLFWEVDIPSQVFWWGNRDANSFKTLWQDVVVYLRDEKKVRNAIYVFSPAGSNPNVNPADVDYVPDAKWFDVLGLTAYSDRFADTTKDRTQRITRSYLAMTNRFPNKPFGFTEAGPHSPTAVYDWNDFRVGLTKHFSRLTFFVAHNNGWSLSESAEGITIDGHKPNRGVKDLFSDRRVVSLPPRKSAIDLAASKVSDVAELVAAVAKANVGETIEIAAGTYQLDAPLELENRGDTQRCWNGSDSDHAHRKMETIHSCSSQR